MSKRIANHQSNYPTASLFNEDLALERTADIAAALRRAQNALEEARRQNEPTLATQALVSLAEMRFRLGQYRAARALAEEALGQAHPVAPDRARALQVLGNCAAETGCLVEAEEWYRQAAELAREIGYHRARMAALHGLAAGVYFPRGQFDLALAADEQAQEIALDQGQPGWLIYPLVMIALIRQLTGQRERSRAALEELSGLISPGTIVHGYHLCISASLALDEEEWEEAQALYGRARSIAEATGEPWLNISVRLGLSRYRRLTGDAPGARAWADDALSFASRIGYRHEQGRALIERGRAVWLGGDLLAAESDLQSAADLLEQLGAAFDLARARLLLAALRLERHAPPSEFHAAWLEAVSSIVSGGYVFLLEQERPLAVPLLAAGLNSANPRTAAVTKSLLEHLARVSPPPLHVVTLGRLEIRQGKRMVEKRALRKRRAGEVFALLLLAPSHTLSFEQVTEALCPERGPRAAQSFFHHATSSLRHALEPDLPEKFPSRYLEVEEGWITLRLPSNSWVDFEAFESHCRREEWEAALSLYGGEFLPEFRYADWAIAPRERLSLLYQRALLAAARSRLAAGRLAEALEACQRLLALEPWHEEAVFLGMRACVALNDLAGACRLYLALEKALREDLGIAPHEQLRAFYHSITSSSAP